MKFDDYLAEKLKDASFEREYKALEPEYAIAQAIIDARKQCGLTQKQFADISGIKQSNLSKIESGSANPSIKTLMKIAKAMKMNVKIEFVPQL